MANTVTDTLKAALHTNLGTNPATDLRSIADLQLAYMTSKSAGVNTYSDKHRVYYPAVLPVRRLLIGVTL